MSLPLGEHPEVRSALDLFTAWTEAQMAYLGQPGLSVGLVHDQGLVWARGFGWADIEARRPAAPDTIYRIASITKLFTATALLHLRDAGALQLDDPVRRHLPWFSIRSAHDDAPPITLRHLVTHTSGLPREAAFPYWTSLEFPDVEEIRRALPGQDAPLPTETRWKYSNLALALAGEVVVAASGEPYDAYLRRHVLEPLGMADTWVRTPPADAPRLATGYGRRLPGAARAVRPLTDGRGLTSAANMSSTVEDLARFAMLQFRRGPAGSAQVLRGSTLAEMQRIHWLEPDWQAGWGLGFRIVRQPGRTLVGHAGSMPGHRTAFQLWPEEKIGVIVLTNADDGNPQIYVDKAFAWIAPALARAAAPPTTTATPDPGWACYAGRYRNPWLDVQVLVLDGQLSMIDPSQPDPLLGSMRLHPAGPHTFRIETREGFGSSGELAIFELGPDGRVSRIKVGANYIDPVPDW